MHICMLSFSHDPCDGRIYHREAKSLAKYGYLVSILSLGKGEKNGISDENINIKCIEVIHSNIYILFLIKLFVLFREAFKINADIYHCHEPESHIVGLVVKIFRRKKLILDVHEYYRDLIKNAGRFYGYFYMLTSYIIEPLLCWLDDFIICADDEIKQVYNKFNKNVLTVFNYPVLNYWETNCNQIPDIPKTKHILIYAGDISEIRGVWQMLAVMAELAKIFTDVRLLLIGSISSSDLKEKISHYIKIKKLENAVTFIGHVPHQYISSYMKLSSIGLLLYKPFDKFYKNIPTKQYEYAASGLAVIASDLPPIRKFILKSRCGILVSPENITETVDAISYLFNNPSELNMLGSNGEKIVFEKFNWNCEETKLIDVYNRISHGVMLS